MTRLALRQWSRIAVAPPSSSRVALLSPYRGVYSAKVPLSLPYAHRGLQTQVPGHDATQAPGLTEESSKVLEEFPEIGKEPFYILDASSQILQASSEVLETSSKVLEEITSAVNAAGLTETAGSDPALRSSGRRVQLSSEEQETKYRSNYRPEDWAAVEKLSRFQELKNISYGFCFDIDGVLIQGAAPVPGAKEVLHQLAKNNLRFAFLTNGGGTSERAKVDSLKRKLRIMQGPSIASLRADWRSMVVSHTPFDSWPENIKKNDTVLVTGHDASAAKQVLRKQYKFAKVFTPEEIYRVGNAFYPFSRPPARKAIQLSEPNVQIPSDPYDYSSIPDSALKIDHILVFNDPRDWSLDVQLISDLLLSHKGYLGTLSKNNGDATLENNGWQRDGQPQLWFSNLDLFWKTQYPINRYGTGAFVEALKGVWRATTGGAELEYKALGKPHAEAHAIAEGVLRHKMGPGRRMKRVYMIGDNPESDIRGANEFRSPDGVEWVSILVRTGVWKPTEMEPEPRYKPAVVVDSVVEAVEWAIGREEKEHGLLESAKPQAVEQPEA